MQEGIALATENGDSEVVRVFQQDLERYQRAAAGENWTCHINCPLASSPGSGAWDGGVVGAGIGAGSVAGRCEPRCSSAGCCEGNSQVHLSFVILIQMRSTWTVVA